MSATVNLISWGLALIGVYLSLRGYKAYSQSASHGKVNNNIIFWGILVFITVTNASSYFNMNNDWAMVLMPATGSVACIVVFIQMLKVGKFEQPTEEDLYILLLGGVAVLVWILGEAKLAHFVIVATFSIGALPTIKKIIANPTSEDPRPWILWSRAFMLGVIVVFMRSHHLFVDLIYPLGCLIGDSSMALITTRARIQKRSIPAQ